MHRLGIINLGLDTEKFKEFKQGVLDARGNEWKEDVYYSHYTKINPTEIAESCDALVLSPGPGGALVGILDHNRALRDQQIGPLYSLIQAAIIEGDVPVLGVNAGYEALIGSLGCGIKKIPDEEIDNYHKKRVHDLRDVTDPITEGVDEISMTLTNNWRVLLVGGQNQRKRWGRSAIKHLTLLGNYALMSKVTKSDAPVYGVQFNIENGTQPIFKNFFKLAHQYLENKGA